MAGGYAIGPATKVTAMILRTLLLLAIAGAAAPSVDARPRDREQDAAFKEMQKGRFLPLPAIEGRIVPLMRGFAYLGPELDPHAGVYRLKFMRGAQLVWIDVDARTGQVIRRTGF